MEPTNLNTIPTQPLSKKQRREQRRSEKLAIRAETQKSSARNRILLWSITLGILTIIIIGMVKLAAISPTAPTGEVAAPTANDWTKGTSTAHAVLIEYSDFQCPYCAQAHPSIKRLTEELGDKLLFVYRNYPLPTHKNAHLAAQAAEAAGKQQKFWEMHDWLFEHQADWAENSSNDARNKFIATAEQFGLNKDQFTRDLDSSEIKKLIQEDIDSGNQADLQGTPTFYLNGKLLPLPASYDQLKTIVQQATTASSTP